MPIPQRLELFHHDGQACLLRRSLPRQRCHRFAPFVREPIEALRGSGVSGLEGLERRGECFRALVVLGLRKSRLLRLRRRQRFAGLEALFIQFRPCLR